MFCMFSSRIHTVQYVQYVQCDLQDSAKFASSMIFERLAEPFLAFLLTVLTVESVEMHAVQVARLVWQLQCLGEDGSLADEWWWMMTETWSDISMWKHADAEISAINCFGMTGLCGQCCEAVVYGRVWPPQRRIKSFTTESWHSSADLTFFPPFPPFRPSAFVPMAPFCIVIERWSQTTVICKGLRIFSVMSGTVPATSCMPFGSLGNRYELEATPVLLFWVDRSEPTRLMYPRPTRYLHRVRS